MQRTEFRRRPAGLRVPITRLEIRACRSLGLGWPRGPAPLAASTPHPRRLSEPTCPSGTSRRRPLKLPAPRRREAPSDRQEARGVDGALLARPAASGSAGHREDRVPGVSDQQLGAGAGGNPLPAAEGGGTAKLPLRGSPRRPRTHRKGTRSGQDSSFRRGEAGSSAEATSAHTQDGRRAARRALPRGKEGHWEGAEPPLPEFRSHQDWNKRVQLDFCHICVAVPALFGRGRPFGGKTEGLDELAGPATPEAHL